MFELDRCFERILRIGGTDIAIIAELMIIDIFEKGGIYPCKIGQVEGRIEVNLCTAQFPITHFEIQLRIGAQFGNETAIDIPYFLIIDDVAIAEEEIFIKAVG